MAKYSKRHYEDVAKIIRKARIDIYRSISTPSEALTRMEQDFIQLFEEDNENFQERRFLIATGFLWRQSEKE